MWVLAAALMLLSVVWAGELISGRDLRALEQHQGNDSTQALDTPLVAQSFVSPRANLSRIQLHLAGITGLPADGLIRLLSGDGLGGAVLYEAPLSSASLDNPFLTIAFPPIRESAGMSYTIALETPGRPLSTALSLRYNSFDALSSGRMYTQEGAGRGDLTFMLGYRYDLSMVWSDAGHTLSERGWLVVVWLILLGVPGLALLVWLPNRLSAGQRLLAAPALSALALPVFYLVARALGLKLSSVGLWVVVGVCGMVVVLWGYRAFRAHSHVWRAGVTVADVAFWGLLVGAVAVTLAGRLVALRDLQAGMGLDAYHHTLIARLFVEQGGIPSGYEPYAPLVSFTYHYGFHALVATVAMLAGMTDPTELMVLMPQAGQIGTTLPVLSLTLFGWKVSGNRWVGLAAGAPVGMVSIFPAFYVNWSRYTQGLGLALLPVAWVLLLGALEQPCASGGTARPGHGNWSRQAALRASAPFMLAVIGAAGLALTHYRIAMIYGAVVAVYLLGKVAVALRRPRREALYPVWRAGLAGALTVVALLPWLVNLAQNFTMRFVGRHTPTAVEYYSIRPLWDAGLLTHPSLMAMMMLAVVGAVLWVRERRNLVLVLPALTWLVLAVWSNPYLLPVRLPFAGYLDSTTLVTSAWLPVALLGGYALAGVGAWFARLGDPAGRWVRNVWRYATAGGGVALLLGGAVSALALAGQLDSKPYIAQADAEALIWMRDHLARDAYVLANPFAFGWSPRNVHGSDAGLWVPLVTGGIRSSVPPLPAYNERPADPGYLDQLRDLVRYEPFAGQQADWDALKSAGITHIYVGSRGGALDVPSLIASDRTRLVFHKDGAWVFELR
jgi:hypothetical protein